VALVWVAVLVVACYGFVLRPYISRQIGEEVGGQFGGAQEQIESQATQVLPDIVAALPPGEIVVTEQQANEYLAANPGSYAPLDAITVRIVPGEVQADLQAQGLNSRAAVGLEARDGQVVAVNPRLDGPLGLAISAEELARSLFDQLNRQLAAQGKSAQDVRVEQGRVVVGIRNAE
jgi:hypothetical protein